jgi:hypothetical protein
MGLIVQWIFSIFYYLRVFLGFYEGLMRFSKIYQKLSKNHKITLGKFTKNSKKNIEKIEKKSTKTPLKPVSRFRH